MINQKQVVSQLAYWCLQEWIRLRFDTEQFRPRLRADAAERAARLQTERVYCFCTRDNRIHILPSDVRDSFFWTPESFGKFCQTDLNEQILSLCRPSIHHNEIVTLTVKRSTSNQCDFRVRQFAIDCDRDRNQKCFLMWHAVNKTDYFWFLSSW